MAVGGMLIAGVLGAFFVGRAYERRVNPPVGPRIVGMPFDDSGGTPVRNDTEVGEGDVFDRADDAALEPERQAIEPRKTAASSTPRPRQGQPVEAVAADDGSFFVQVFAGRDQSAAAGLVDRLEEGGHKVRLLTEREGAGALYKVRVGGFSTRERAGQAAQALQGQGYSGAWVTRER